MNMMPITAGILEPLAESIPLGIYASWSVYFLFGVDPYLWSAGHWVVWIVLDYIQLRGIQVGCVSIRIFTFAVTLLLFIFCFLFSICLPFGTQEPAAVTQKGSC